MHKAGGELYLQYRGLVQYDTIGYLISELKEKMFEAQIKQSIYKKVLMVMIEALENVFKYHEHFVKEKKLLKDFPPQITISRHQKYFIIESSNPIKNNDIIILKKRLDEITSLDKEGVKEAYKQTITNGQFSEKGGAGLGLIEMAKITDEKVSFQFVPINNNYNYFTLKLKIYCN